MRAADRAQRTRSRNESAELIRKLSSTPGMSASCVVADRIIRQNDSMASIITMLVRRLRQHDSADDVAASAMAFLLREGLPTSLLKAPQLELQEFAQGSDKRIAQPIGEGANIRGEP